MSTTKFSKNVAEVFQSTDWLPNILAGLISGLVALTYSLSLAALVFSGSLASYLPQGVNAVLISAAIIDVGVALGSSLPFAIAGPDPNSTAILALIAAAIATQLESQNQPGAIFPTVSMAIAISAISILWEQENGIGKRLRTLSTGNIFGEIACYRNSQRSASAIADKPSNLYRLSKESLEKMEVCDLQLANVLHQYVIRLLTERLTQTTKN